MLLESHPLCEAACQTISPEHSSLSPSEILVDMTSPIILHVYVKELLVWEMKGAQTLTSIH